MGDLYVEYEYWITFVQLMFAMTAMGATLQVRDFRAIVQRPHAFLTGMVAQMVAVPLVAFAVLRVLDLDAGVAVGIAILAAIPGGTVSNVFTFAGKGDVPLSIALTAVTSLVCVLSVPFVLEWLVGPFVPPGFALPRGRIAVEIVVTLLLPLLAGMFVLRRWPQHAVRLSKAALIATAALIGVIVIGSALAGRLDAKAMGFGNLTLVGGFALAMAGVGIAATKLAQRPRSDLTAIAVETTVRNTNLGLLVRTSVFGTASTSLANPIADLALFTILAYAGISFAVVAPILISGRR